MGLRGGKARAVAVAWVLGLSGGLAGCGGEIAPEVGIKPEGSCVDDSVACIAKRQATLRAMLADRDRKWVRDPAGANAYAGGVRLFAFKTRKKELSCPELAAGRREAEAGPALLRGPAGKHLTLAQVSRGVMLSTEVSRELSGELKRRRCPV